VETRIGQTISRYSAAPPAAKARPQQANQSEAGFQPPGLDLVSHQLALARDLVERRAMLIEQLQQLQPVLLEIAARSSSPEQLVNEETVLARLNGLRHRLSRWLGQHQKIAAREEHAELLIELAAETVAIAQERCQLLEQERLALLHQLASSGVAELASALPLHDPEHSAARLWQRAIEHQHQRWLREQLAQQSLRAWRIAGFGESRMALLERHGLERGDQLLERADHLSDLPGIGRVLQQRLRQRLRAEVEALQAQQAQSNASLPPQEVLTALLGDEILVRIQQHQQRIDALQAEAAGLAIRVKALNQEISNRFQQRDELLRQYDELF
jgi:hypothetical protein